LRNALIVAAGVAAALVVSLVVAGGRSRAAPTPPAWLIHVSDTVVAADGTALTAATFPTPGAASPADRYVLAVLNAVGGAAAVDAVQVTLNGDVAFQNAEMGAGGSERVEVALNAPAASNQVVVSCIGAPGSALRASFVGIPTPATGGMLAYPFARTTSKYKTVLTLEAAGSATAGVRIVFRSPDGTLVGATAPRQIAPHATTNVDLASAAQALGIDWQFGPVEVRWAARGHTRLVGVASEIGRRVDASGAFKTVLVAGPVALEEAAAGPVTPAVAAALLDN
jgi:hypothetical protein